MCVLDLWPPVFGCVKQRTPAAVLQLVAAELGRRMRNVVLARVHRGEPDPPRLSDAEPDFIYTLDLVAPCLDHLGIPLLSIRHGVMMYPLILTPRYPRKAAQINISTEGEFIEALRPLLGSDEMRRLINSVLTQSQVFISNGTVDDG